MHHFKKPHVVSGLFFNEGLLEALISWGCKASTIDGLAMQLWGLSRVGIAADTDCKRL